MANAYLRSSRRLGQLLLLIISWIHKGNKISRNTDTEHPDPTNPITGGNYDIKKIAGLCASEKCA